MIRTAIIFLTIGPLTCLGGRYVAPSPAKVYFPYKRIPSLTELIENEGYRHDEFKVVTEDGFVIAAHRISSNGNNTKKRGFPVLTMNGFIFQSDGWMTLGSSSLPFILARNGYDVWLGEPRGDVRSLGHLRYSSDDPRKYNYTFHEHGVYDLPAFTDFILKKTGYKQLLFVGYSLSAGLLIVMNSERPEYNEKFAGAFLMAPAGHLRKFELNSPTYLATLNVLDSMVESQINAKKWLIFGNLDFVKNSIVTCQTSVLKDVCGRLIFGSYGNSDHMDPKFMFYQFATTVTTTSVFVGKHLVQTIKHGRFCKYDYGERENERIYGQKTPPNYNFERTTMPTFVVSGGSDLMVTTEAVKRTVDELKNVRKYKYIPRFNHADFIFSKSAPVEVYEDVVEFFDELVNSTKS